MTAKEGNRNVSTYEKKGLLMQIHFTTSEHFLCPFKNRNQLIPVFFMRPWWKGLSPHCLHKHRKFVPWRGWSVIGGDYVKQVHSSWLHGSNNGESSMIFMASLKISDQISKHFLQCTTSILQLASTPLENKNNTVRELHEPNSNII